MNNNEDMKKAMEEFKDFQPTEEQIEIIGEMKDSVSDKSEDEVFFEIIRLNDEMEQKLSKEEYEEIFKKLDSMRPLLDREQLEKLDRILYILEQE